MRITPLPRRRREEIGKPPIGGFSLISPFCFPVHLEVILLSCLYKHCTTINVSYTDCSLL